MKFDIEKFRENIEGFKKRKEDIKDESGFVNVVRHIINYDFVDDVDFNAFTLQDTLRALNAIEDDLVATDNDYETFIFVPTNPYYIFHEVDKRVFNLATSKDKHFKIEDEDNFFI